MADRNFDFIQTLGKGRKIIAGSFLPNGSSAIVADPLWNGFTVAYTSTGLYTVTLTDSYVALISATHGLQLNTAADIKLQWGLIDVVTARTLQIRSLAVAALTDIAANANNRIFFELILRNTTVTP